MHQLHGNFCLILELSHFERYHYPHFPIRPYQIPTSYNKTNNYNSRTTIKKICESAIKPSHSGSGVAQTYGKGSGFIFTDCIMHTRLCLLTGGLRISVSRGGRREGSPQYNAKKQDNNHLNT